jgi:hypothetical protein
MKLINALLAAFLALSLCAGSAQAAEPEERFMLTPALLQKMKAATAEMKKMKKPGDDDDEDDAKDDLSSDEFARELAKDPRSKAALAKHGVSPRDFALGTYALLHAGLYVAMTPNANARSDAKAMADFTSEQKANIALLRKLGPSSYQWEK